MDNHKLAYLCCRISLGLGFFMHGAVRLPKLGSFAEGISSEFAETLLSGYPSLAAGFVIPIVEAASGILILLGGKFIRWGLAAGALLMGVLMFGSGLIENWSAVMAQLVHLGIFYLLLINRYTPGPDPEKNLPKASS
ncbi:DoxX family protein [Puniceicoccus vermicola]|uniref:DoxX family protein n=1 Tax=Puniceicoccus vermicola TaxID=388746 RepID=A0A7X1E618_9BACT|nr:DoxX family protein [Puniceicoccus vermicola]MBC2603739.1 DoxX family protein [Puniceicoccus vermicola]